MAETAAAKDSAEEGIRHFPPVEDQSRWELGWFEDAAELLGRADDVKAARKARQHSDTKGKGANPGENDLPVILQP
jgi:hypothetical protein